MKSQNSLIPFTILLVFHAFSIVAQETRYFRVSGPVATIITGLTPDGTLSWTNTPTNAIFTIQSTTDLGNSNWFNWCKLSVTETTTTHRIYDPSPPTGMVYVPAGIFPMGGHLAGYTAQLPIHDVYVSALFVDRNEVTKALWDEVYLWATNHGYSFAYADSGQGIADQHPVHSLIWHDAVKWCNAKSEKEGLIPAYYLTPDHSTVYRTGQVLITSDCVKWNAGYRLPTEAEWEKVARGGTEENLFPWGNAITHFQANYNSTGEYPFDANPTIGYHPSFENDNKPYTSPVGSFPPNAYGLHDVIGNVNEWCWDGYSSSYYSSSPFTNPRGPNTGARRVNRGGSWGDDALGGTLIYRPYTESIDRWWTTGFRTVLTAHD